MKSQTLVALAAALLLPLTGCVSVSAPEASEAPAAAVGPADPEIDPLARNLFANLRRIAPEMLLFGHQDDLAYGVNWKAEPGRSDVKDVSGAYPAVYGWELGDLENGAEVNLDGVRFADMPGWIREGYKRGGLITISWHMDNPVTGGSSWDKTPAVATLLPGGSNHAKYRAWLDRFIAFDRQLTINEDGSGGLIPIVFRPFHEHSGSWFWWGGANVSAEDYKTLWRFTFDYLRAAGLHNLLYGYSTDVVDSPEAYLQFYPGDDYVDVMGMDDYQSLKSPDTVHNMTRRLAMLVRLAEARGKIPALTETGSGGQSIPDWWTGRLLKAINADPDSRRIAWVLVWRNANLRQHYVPLPGGVAAEDFRRFHADPTVRFGDEMPDLYSAPRN